MSHQFEIVERATDGTLLPIASLKVTYSYPDANTTRKDVVFNGVTYRKTITTADSKLASETPWTRQ